MSLRSRVWGTVGGGVAAGALACGPAAAQAPPPVSAYPGPGTLTASARTQISFRGLPPGALGAIDVRGSRSGRHDGALRAHSDGQGASFVPSEPFRDGETVTVATRLNVVNGRDGDFRFRIARTPGPVPIGDTTFDRVEPGMRRRFRSRPDLEPPIVRITARAPGATPGRILLGPKPRAGTEQAGPMIVDDDGVLVYFRPVGGKKQATDVRVQRYQGRPVLTWWQGTSRHGIGTGHFVIVDEAYREVARIQTPNGYRGDLHEFLITPRDTALVIAYPNVRVDLSSVGGSPRGRVIDSVIQEIDLATGLVLFEWHSVGNVPIRDSYKPLSPSFRVPHDYFHANSVGLDADGDFLVSARNTWGVYKIDRASGAVEWTLGGKSNDFKLGRGARFAWQHDVRRRADGAITLFDNAAAPPTRKRSRAIALAVDEGGRTVTLATAHAHPRGLLAATQGNVQALPNGNALVGWGSQRYFTEYAPDGRVVWDAHLAIGYDTYRAYRAPWTGRPHTQPRAAGRRRGRAMDVYASWNGATEVAAWDVLAGPRPDALAPAGSAPRRGFETVIRVPAAARYVAVLAKDAAGQALGTSPPRRVSG